MVQENEISDLLLDAKSIHIIGSGLNSERPAHRAIHDLDGLGWRLVPVHVRDAGATIRNIPIRKEIDEGIMPEIVVLFLAPQRALDIVKKFLFRFSANEFPLIWFQRGAEQEDAIAMLEQSGLNFVSNDCIVEFIKRNSLSKKQTLPLLPWYRQVKDNDDDGCSIWTAHNGNEEIELSENSLEWVGDIIDLEYSQHIIPRYIRSMMKTGQSLEDLALSLS
tara:strand:+ start:1295 stop:1954 length:660 start_codon:yes stop_codon:yes gene_type:complete